ncbi:MAG: hypothetical protein IJ003_05740 [Candidatus Gastranaerophilales bacterium]|nr:hypothetical protein [Candidatus Gastranaerophilales bacterium]
MSRVFNKKLNSVLTLLLLSNIALGLDSEYKNSLSKIELIKTSDNAYSVNLHTQNKFREPIKVIKKSDLNYYILLPETKDISTKTLANSNDIRTISTDSYQYAGMDKLNNGYTKININTTKPINFNVNIKSIADAKTATTEDKVALETKETKQQIKEEKQVQKKNLVSQEKRLEKKYNEKLIVKKAAKVATNKPDLSSIVQNYPTSENNEVEQNTPKENIEKTTEEPKIQEDKFEEFLKSDDLKEIEEIANSSEKKSFKSKANAFSESLSDKLSEYGLTLKDAILMFIAGLISFFIMLFVLNKKPNQTKLKSKADLMEKLDKQDGLVAKDENKKEEKGQYFIFDKNIKQTGFYNPASSATKKKYELSSYDPDLKNNYDKAKVERYKDKQSIKAQKPRNDYDIIQKILKEDSLITVNAIEDNYQPQEPIQEQAPIALKQQPKEEVASEPIVLSSVEIAPERGFMCVSYNNNINFMGYIFDDVFPLYNFKQPKLENYDIKFRLSEKDDRGANFIVKIGNTRLLTRVTKSSMNLEVVM